MSDLIDISGYDLAALEAAVKAAKEAEKAAARAALAKYGETLAPTIADLIERYPVEPSDTSAWVGTGVQGVPVTVDDRKYTVRIIVTDVEASEARKPAFATTKAKAKK